MTDAIIRTCAVVAAIAVLAGPYLVAKVRGLSQGLPRKASEAPEVADPHVVLEIARRLQAAGNKRGVALCQQLIDVMLSPPGDDKA